MRVLLLLIAAMVAASGAPSDPGRAAVDFLEKVRLRKLDLEPGGDTALSPQTAAVKKGQIARNLERMARDLGNDPLEVSAVKLDENFAAVLVRKLGGFDPSRLQIFPIALVKRDSEWTVAPVPASFENSGIGYALELRNRLEKLETWMLRGQITDLEQLREQSATRMREMIEAHLSVKDLSLMNAKSFGEGFLNACYKKDVPSILGYLGGLATKLPDDWPSRLKATEQAIASGNAAARPWRLLTSPEVARVIVDHEEYDRRGLVSLACLDPAGVETDIPLPQIELIHFELSRDDSGLWQINLPETFLSTDLDSDQEPDGELDFELRDAFTTKWIEKSPLKPKATAELAHKALVEALGSGNFATVLAISKIDGEPSVAKDNCILAAKISQLTQSLSAVSHLVPLTLHTTDKEAVGLYQIFTARDPEKFKPTPLYFEKSPTGWLWAPLPTRETLAKFSDWVESEKKTWRDQWQQLVLGSCPIVPRDHNLPAPVPIEVDALMRKWFEATRIGDVKAALDLVARLDDPKSAGATLQNLGYEITNSRRSDVPPAIIGVFGEKFWSAAGVKVDQAGESVFPFYPVIQTRLGPRILIEIDLFASKNRGREFLNKAAFSRLEKGINNTLDLQILHTEFKKTVEVSEFKDRQ